MTIIASAIGERFPHQAAIHVDSTLLHRDDLTVKLAAIKEDHGDSQRQPNHSHRPQRREKMPVGNARKTSDHHVLRISSDGGHASDIGRHRHRQQVRHGIAPQRPGDLEHQRRQHQAHGVVDEERREDSGHATIAISNSSGLCARSTTRSATSEKARQLEVRHHDHHAEQQDDGVEIDGAISRIQRKRVHAHHEARADDGRASPVDPEAGQPADGQHQIRNREDENGGQATRPAGLYQLKITSPKKPTPSAATPRKVPNGSS
jgi:hypothetical protein